MLTAPILYTSLAVAAVMSASMIYSIVKKKYGLAFLSYFFAGWFCLAVPLKAALAATSAFGMIFISLIWPIWLGQNLGYSVVDYLPLWFTALMFNI
jgi:hypothetical protein